MEEPFGLMSMGSFFFTDFNTMRIHFLRILALFLGMTSCVYAYAQKRSELAKTPPMGWNSWNWFGKADINETIVMETIDAMVAEGLRDAGYTYVVIDGGWRDTMLDPSGRLLVHPEKFPNGIKPLVDYAHANGLKLGLHTVPGTHDCGGDKVGGYGHEAVHVSQFVEWGVDFIKLDRCGLRLEADPATGRMRNAWTEENIYEVYSKWGRLLKDSGRDILYSISAYEFRDWNPAICNISRTTLDIGCRISGGALFHSNDPAITNHLPVIRIAEINNKYAQFAGNGYWNDPDMLVTGNQGLTIEEQRVHFALWCIMSAPLMLGNDIRNMSNEEKAIILNKKMIAINQDTTEQGVQIVRNNDTQVWAKNLKNGDVAVLMINLNTEKSQRVRLNLSDIGLSGRVSITDIYQDSSLGKRRQRVSQTIRPNSGSMLLIKP